MMFVLELKKVLFDHDWKYLILVLIVSILYGVLYYNDLPISIGTGIFSVMTHDELLCSIAAFPAFLFMYVFFRILHHQETHASWKCTLAFPKDQKKHLITMLVLVLLFQVIAFMIGNGVYYVFTQCFNEVFSNFLISLNLIYLVCYFYYTYMVKSGIMTQGINQSVVNPLRSLTPAFLVCCILNIGDWLTVLSMAVLPITLLVLILMGILVYQCNVFMSIKLHRELILDKLFTGVQYSGMEMISWKVNLDRILQFIFQHLPFHSARYWRFVAVFDVSIKQKGYLLLVMMIAMFEYICDRKIIFLFLSFLSFFVFLRYYHKQKQKINEVRILANINKRHR